MMNYQRIKKLLVTMGTVTLLGMSMQISNRDVHGAATVIHGIDEKGGKLLWSDEFNGSSIDTTKWDNSSDLFGGAVGSTIYTVYKPELAKVKDGNLIITAEVELDSDNKICDIPRTAVLSTKNLVYLQNGRMEIRARLPKGQGIASYGYLLSNESLFPLSGSIDIFEQSRYTDKSNIIQSIWTGQFNGVPEGEEPRSKRTDLSSQSSEYHIYSIEWRKDRIDFYIDGTYTWSYNPNDYATADNAADDEKLWPFNQPFYLNIKNQFGLTGGILTTEGWTKTDTDGKIQAYQDDMYIDYVRIYSLPEKETVNKQKNVGKVKIKSAKRVSKKSITIKFKKAKNAKKYQIQYATNKKFKKAVIKTTKKRSYTIKKLSKNKTYYVRVRGVNGTKNGKWSKAKTVKAIK